MAVSVKHSKAASLLLGVCALGLLLTALITVSMIFVSRSFPSEAPSSFYDALAGYDATAGAAPADTAGLIKQLDQLEKKAAGVENLLSVLKRRRALVLNAGSAGPAAGEFRRAYAAALRRALKALPFSPPLAALASEELLWDNPAIDPGAAAELSSLACRVGGEPLLAFALHALAGDLESPEAAAALPQAEGLFAALLAGQGPVSPDERGLLGVDLAILRLLRGDIPAATAQVNSLIAQAPSFPVLEFAAEFLYDYGDPLEAAKLFARLPGEKNLGRQADALSLAGHRPRSIWRAIIAPAPQGEGDPALRARGYYNLAVSAESRREELNYLEQLIAQNAQGPGAGAGESAYAIVRYTRLFNAPRAIAILEGLDRGEALLDLEWYRRQGESWTVERALAETWLLLNRHPGDARIYRWAAYYFDRQHRYEDTALVLKEAAHNQVEGPWVELHRGLTLLREGRLAEGDALLAELAAASRFIPWQVFANLGRVQEARRRPTQALESYETAAGLAGRDRDAVRVQLGIARCLRSLGREQELRRVLEYALDLDPENLNVRLELHRLAAQGL